MIEPYFRPRTPLAMPVPTDVVERIAEMLRREGPLAIVPDQTFSLPQDEEVDLVMPHADFEGLALAIRADALGATLYWVQYREPFDLLDDFDAALERHSWRFEGPGWIDDLVSAAEREIRRTLEVRVLAKGLGTILEVVGRPVGAEDTGWTIWRRRLRRSAAERLAPGGTKSGSLATG